MQRRVGALLSSVWLSVRRQAASALSRQQQHVLSSVESAAAGIGPHWLQLLLAAPYATRGGRSGEAAGGSWRAKELTSRISSCRDVQELTQLMERHEAALNHIHTAAALVAAAKMRERMGGSGGRDQDGFMDCIQRLTAAARRQLGACGPWALANMMWAVARLGPKGDDEAFIKELLGHARPKLQRFNPQDLANTAWALARLGHVDKQFTEQLLQHARPKLHDFSAQGLANTAWALATLGHVDEQFMEQLLGHARPKLHDFSAQGLANTAWALATLGHVDEQFTEQLLGHARPKLHDFSAQGLANTVWALATLGHVDKQFMEQLLGHARPKLQRFNPQDLANTVWSLATLNHQDPAFVDQLLEQLLIGVSSLNIQDLSNTVWALSILDHSASQAVRPLLAAASMLLLSPNSQAAAPVQALCQVYQYLVNMEAAGHISSSDQAARSYQQLRGRCQRAWAEAVKMIRPSSTHKEVLQCLRLLPGWAHAESERLTEDQLLSMDIALQLPCGTKVAVEVDGPFHFMSNAPRVPNGSTVWRNRMLEARGWRLVSVPVVEWSAGQGPREAPGVPHPQAQGRGGPAVSTTLATSGCEAVRNILGA